MGGSKLGESAGGDARYYGGWRRRLSIAASRVRADIAFAVIDLFIVIAAYTMAVGIRLLDPLVGERVTYFRDLAIAMPVILAVHLLANVVGGAYGHIWRHASVSEAVRVIAANASAAAALMVLELVTREYVDVVVPITAIAIGGFLSAGGMGLVRFRSRLFSLRRVEHSSSNVLVVGDGFDAAVFARKLAETKNGSRPVGFVVWADGASSNVRRMASLPILGTVADIPQVVVENDVSQVVVVGNDPLRTRAVVDLCIGVPVRLRIAPGIEDVMEDRVSSLDVRDIHVEDILVRPPVEIDLDEAFDLIGGKVVLVTGAGGSIGSEIVRQLQDFAPAELWALDRDETLLHEAGLIWSGIVQHLLADVRDSDGITRIFERVRPDIVFHAAALKHVPMLEANPTEAVLTNIVGTRNVIEAGSRVGVRDFVLISTDKAVNPESVMGATKRVAELMTQSGNERGDDCNYSAVRFGNVLGSRGSVVPTFVEQIRQGGPVTVTDPEMTRYFMTVREAVQLVVQAAALAKDSEVFFLDMGEPVKIVDLARRMIRLAGRIPDRDIRIVFTGRRPGEKLNETLANGPMNRTRHPKILEVELESVRAPLLFEIVSDMEDAARRGDVDTVLTGLARLVGPVSEEGDVVVDLAASAPVAQPQWS